MTEEFGGQIVIPGCEAKPPEELDERYTLRETLIACMNRMGVTSFDLDVAACEESHCAPKWFDKHADGLLQHWFGHVWCNPPYSSIEPWLMKAWLEWDSRSNNDYDLSSISMLLPATRTEQPWWQKWVEDKRDCDDYLQTWFIPGRVSFGHPGNPLGVGVGSPPFGCVLLHWR